MSIDWAWTFSNTNQRERYLKDEVESLGSALSSANQASYRLSSQLANLQGSLETRLNALSAAFDAYVELGDVREQLAGFPDTSAVRRDVVEAIGALSAGRTPEPVDPRGLDYWLPYAVNAVIGIAVARPDVEADRRATELDQDAEWFIVALSGVLGQGDAVADRVAPLLVCDGTLSRVQVALWTAAYEGVFGPVLERIGEAWAPNLRALSSDQAEWTGWVRDAAGGRGSAGLAWLRQQTATEPPSDAADGSPSESDEARNGLRLLVMQLVEQGYGGETELLARARTLRQRIEDPGAARTAEKAGAVAGDAAAGLDTALLDQVRAGFLATDPGSDEHRTITGWLRSGLEAAVQGLRQEVTAEQAADLTAQTGSRTVAVTSAGADAAQLAAAEQRIAASNEVSSRGQQIGAVVGAVLAALAAILALRGSGVAAFLTLVLAGVAGVYAWLQWRQRQAGLAAAADQRAQLTADIAAVQQRAIEGEQRLLAVKQESGGIADEVLRQLGSPAEHPPVAAVAGR